MSTVQASKRPCKARRSLQSYLLTVCIGLLICGHLQLNAPRRGLYLTPDEKGIPLALLAPPNGLITFTASFVVPFLNGRRIGRVRLPLPLNHRMNLKQAKTESLAVKACQFLSPFPLYCTRDPQFGGLESCQAFVCSIARKGQFTTQRWGKIC